MTEDEQARAIGHAVIDMLKQFPETTVLVRRLDVLDVPCGHIPYAMASTPLSLDEMGVGHVWLEIEPR